MSTIHSNGNVVPCTYDCSGGMKVGNILKDPYTKIWNSLNYRALRKKIYYDRNSISKCDECTIGFKHSEAGWFVEAHDFNISMKKRAVDHFKRFAKLVLPQKAVEAIRRKG